MVSMRSAESELKSRLETLTAKQTEVLDLLIEHKTSKEIARELDISPHTVDQRINFSKKKLGAVSRGELAVTYRAAKEICDQSVYQGSHIASTDFMLDGEGTDDVSNYTLLEHPDSMKTGLKPEDEVEYRVVPEMFEGSTGKLARIGAMILVAVMLVFIGLAGLAMFSGLSEVLAD